MAGPAGTVGVFDFEGRPQDARGPALEVMEHEIGDLAACVGLNHLQCLLLVDPASVPNRWRQHAAAGYFSDESEAAKAALRSELARVVAADCVTSQLPFTRKLIEAMPRLQMVVRQGVGYDNVDLAAADERGIAVCNVPDYGTEEVTDHAFALMMSLLRRTTQHAALIKGSPGVWNTYAVGPVRRIRGMTVGLLGFGRMGKAFALRAKAFGLVVQFFDPYVVNGEEKALGVTRCETLKEMLQSSDIVNIHCALTEETAHLINAATLGMFKPGAYLVNTARGGVVDMEAVQAVLQDGRLAGAGIDVLDVEQIDEYVTALAQTPNLELSPHCAWYSEEAALELRTKCGWACKRVVLDEPPQNVVNHPAADVVPAAAAARL
jgi:lactate dehydrogenase-like 2-hydroxyacid dehydrogenase